MNRIREALIIIGWLAIGAGMIYGAILTLQMKGML
jgi:hypothetical protein